MISAFAADSFTSSAANSKPWDVDLLLRSTIYLPTPRPVQDVYIVLNNSTPYLVYRVERSQAEEPAILAKEAYATTSATPHDVYKISHSPLGPFPRGKDLGFTQEDWLEAIGTGTYVEENGIATLNLTFEHLVPNGTYSVWINRVTMPPHYQEVFTPIGAPDGSENAFKADSSGHAVFNMKIKPLPASTNVTFKDFTSMFVTKSAPISADITWTLIVVVYHSDGRTYGANPGDLGESAHGQLVHLMYAKPIRSFQEWKNATEIAAANDTVSSPTPQKQPGFGGVLAIIGLLASTGFIMSRMCRRK
ncbi:MAG: PGF-CTERM sorting domain-containing protein [Methanothrix sp.]